MKKERQWIHAAKGIAILGVMAIHVAQSVFGGHVGGVSSGLVMKGVSFGVYGVQLFFMLSAYTMCVSYANYRLDTDGSVWRFMLNKYCRLLPLYWLGMVAYYGYWRITGKPVPAAHQILANTCIMNTFCLTDQNACVPGGWSISCIAVFCFVFPILFGWVARRKFVWLSILFILLASGTFLLFRSGVPDVAAYWCVTNQLIVFLAGMLMFMCKDWMDILERIRIQVLFAMMIPCMALVFLLAMKKIGYPYFYLFRHVPASLAFVLLVSCLRKWEGSLPLMLIRIGRKTYSLFIIHFIVAWEVAERVASRIRSPVIGFLTGYLLTVGVSYCLAIVIDRFYEVPLLNLKNRLFSAGQSGRVG